jgi:Uma2 family endonuclease
MATQLTQSFTVADLEALPEDGNSYELIGGELFVSRAPHLFHQLSLKNILGPLFVFLEENPIGVVIPEPGVIFDEHDAVQPDIVFISAERFDEAVSPDGKLIAAPDLVIEILSPDKQNARRDRELKRKLYAAHGVKEYWIVDQLALSVEVYRLGSEGLKLAETRDAGEQVTSPLLPGFSLPVAKIFKFSVSKR